MNRLLALAMVASLGVCAIAQSFASGQVATDGHSYSIAGKGLGPDMAVAFYDRFRLEPRGWLNYGPVLGSRLDDGVGVGGFGAWGAYEFERRTRLCLTGSASYVFPQHERGAFVFGIGIGVRI